MLITMTNDVYKWNFVTPRQTTPEPEHTETSYNTVPETNKTESETKTIEIDTNIVGESSRIKDDPMGDNSKNDDPKVIKLNLPKDFSGKREDLKKFLQQVNLYMDVNMKIYHNDMTKIAFVLSFMDEGDASSWKEQFLEEAMSTSPHDYGTWIDFERNLKEAFQPFNTPGDALEEIKNLQMGNNLIEDHNAKFQMLLTKSKLNKTSPAIINYYRKTLNLPLQKQLLRLELPPPPYKDGTTNPPHTTISSKKSNESLDEEDPITIRRKNQGRRPGHSPRKTPTQWMGTSYPLKKGMKL